MPASQKPAKGTAKRQRAASKRAQAKADRLVYSDVDARDGYRCRVCRQFRGREIQRHHIVPRSRGGPTTTSNVISLCAECHLVGVHGKRLLIEGDADDQIQIKCAVATLNGQVTSWAMWIR
jgi:5-methylcytosine-specific restriction endonuclease McrA